LKRIIFYSILLVFSTPIYAQRDGSDYEIGLGVGLVRLEAGETDLLPVELIFPVDVNAAHYQQENVPVNGFSIPLTLEITKGLEPWFQVGAHFSYSWLSSFSAQEPPAWSANDIIHVRYRNSQGQWIEETRDDLTVRGDGLWRSKVATLKPTAYFDLSWQNEYSHFFVMLMPTLGWVQLETQAQYISEESPPGGGLASAHYVDRQYKLQRNAFYYGLDIGLQWRDYFSEHWGYALTGTIMPWGRGAVHNVTAQKLVIHGETQTIPNRVIRPSEDYPDAPRGAFDFAKSAGFYFSIFFCFG